MSQILRAIKLGPNSKIPAISFSPKKKEREENEKTKMGSKNGIGIWCDESSGKMKKK